MVESFKQTVCQLLLGRFGAKGKFCELNLCVGEFGRHSTKLRIFLCKFDSQVTDLVNEYNGFLVGVNNKISQLLNARLGLCV